MATNIESRAVATYVPTNWASGDIITAEKLNHAEDGIKKATDGLKALEGATASAKGLAAGQAPTVTFSGGKWTFGIPAGATGAKGDPGTPGKDGVAGTPGTPGTNGRDGVTPNITITVSKLAAGANPTVTKGGTAAAPTFAIGIPEGAKGAAGTPGTNGKDGAPGTPGTPGTNGKDGAPGANGKNGSSFRVSATALADNKAGIAATALTPTNAQIPYAVGDIVLDATTKKLYSIKAVAGGVATVGTALATLP